MKINKNTPCMFIRVPDYKDYKAIEEHIKVIKENGYVYMVKLGNYPNILFINKMKENKGILILKSTPKTGNNVYICSIDFNIDKKEFIFPKYYDELMAEEGYTISDIVNNFFIIKITKIKKVEKEILDKFETYSTHKKLTDSVFNSRAPQVYAELTEDIIL